MAGFCFQGDIVGHCGCFHVLAIVENAAVSVRTRVSFQTSVYREIERGVGNVVLCTTVDRARWALDSLGGSLPRLYVESLCCAPETNRQ